MESCELTKHWKQFFGGWYLMSSIYIKMQENLPMVTTQPYYWNCPPSRYHLRLTEMLGRRANVWCTSLTSG